MANLNSATGQRRSTADRSLANNGYAKAIALLRRLQRMNADRERPAQSAALVRDALGESDEWPEPVRLAFSRVIAEWLTMETLGVGYNLEAYATDCTVGRRQAKAHSGRGRGQHKTLASRRH